MLFRHNFFFLCHIKMLYISLLNASRFKTFHKSSEPHQYDIFPLILLMLSLEHYSHLGVPRVAQKTRDGGSVSVNIGIFLSIGIGIGWIEKCSIDIGIGK